MKHNWNMTKTIADLKKLYISDAHDTNIFTQSWPIFPTFPAVNLPIGSNGGTATGSGGITNCPVGSVAGGIPSTVQKYAIGDTVVDYRGKKMIIKKYDASSDLYEGTDPNTGGTWYEFGFSLCPTPKYCPTVPLTPQEEHRLLIQELDSGNSWLLKPESSGCNHIWVDVGFQYTKMVCKLCNKDQT